MLHAHLTEVGVRRLSLALLVGLGLSLFTGSAAALSETDSFGVLPEPSQIDGVERHTFEVPLEEGRTFQDAARIFNKLDREIDLVVYATHALTQEDGSIVAAPPDHSAEGLGAWITLVDNRLRLGAFADAVVPFRIRIAGSDPRPDLAVIVVEQALAPEGVPAGQPPERVEILVRPAPPGTLTGAELMATQDRSVWLLAGASVLFISLVMLLLWSRGRSRSEGTILEAPRVRLATEAPPQSQAEMQTEAEGAPTPTMVTGRLNEPEPADTRASRNGPPEPKPEGAAKPARRKPPRRRRPSKPSGSGRKLNYIPLDEL